MITYSLAARQSIEAAGIGYHLPKNSDERKAFVDSRLPLSFEGMRDLLKQEFEKQERIGEVVAAMGGIEKARSVIGLGETDEVDLG